MPLLPITVSAMKSARLCSDIFFLKDYMCIKIFIILFVYIRYTTDGNFQ